MLNKHSISEKKKNKNLNLPYSTLNPDTSSLSLSARSKGVRPSSINHKIISGGVSKSCDQVLLGEIDELTVKVHDHEPNDLL